MGVTLNGVKSSGSIVYFCPQGNWANGYLSPTVTDGNLMVAVKTLAGSDPSVNDPVYFCIGNVIRKITSTLSVTKNAGTNWCNAGGAELATKEIDYFVYLGYNVTDGVVIGFSRIPYGNIYSDFSATSTAETYCAISTITNAVAGDNYIVIGRFAATLSAGAGYTWSIPTYTSINLVQRPIYETRLLVWSPQYVGFSSNPIQSAKYRANGGKVEYSISTVTAGSSNATNYTFTFPFKATALTYLVCPDQTDNSNHGNGFCQINANSATGTMFRSGLTAWTNTGLKYAETFGICQIK